MKTLILFYTRSGNTEAIARAVAETLQADVEALSDPVSYAGALGYMLGGRDALKGRVADIAALQHDPAGYERIVIGQPVWAARPVPAVNGLAKRYPLARQALALFATFDGGGATGCLNRTAALFPDARPAGQASFQRVGSQRERGLAEARAWAKTLG